MTFTSVYSLFEARLQNESLAIKDLSLPSLSDVTYHFNTELLVSGGLLRVEGTHTYSNLNRLSHYSILSLCFDGINGYVLLSDARI